MKKDEKKEFQNILVIVLAFLGSNVLIKIIREKSMANGIQAFIESLSTNWLGYIISILAVILGYKIGQNIRESK